ncbi:hypothetical protein BSKO_08937 [Bryopsis sp. KO-2023]|nr:hypothetical protein BSKO_08937 [Bryopsis sp. KO-2023]
MVLVENYADRGQNWLKCFNDPKKSDVVFEAKDGQTFHCNKLVLGVASPYFERLFSCGDTSMNFISVKYVDPAALKWVLRSCYSADGDLNHGNVMNVMLASKLYEIDWVEKACLKYLKNATTPTPTTSKAAAILPVATFEYAQKWQEWKVQESGWYHIVATGARAADGHIDSNFRSKGGRGAIIGGSFEFKANDFVQILTGGMSTTGPVVDVPGPFSGGGGGTFVALKKDLSLLLAAGGGGGYNRNMYGADANLGENGAGPDHVVGKDGGNGDNNGNSKGGLGWKAGPVALTQPNTGEFSNGGFGGGGGLCGGGGGYSGGSCGCGYRPGGGGGSYVAPEAENGWKRVGSRSSDHGKVIIWKGKEVPSEYAGDIREESQDNTDWDVLQCTE